MRTVVLASLQAGPEVLERLDRIASAEWVTAVGTVVLALLGVAIAVLALLALRSLNRMLHSVERTVTRLEPHVEPLLDRAGKIAEDASHVSHALRKDVGRLQETLADLHERLYEGLDEAEDRLRRFGAVLRVVQRETEGLLLDAAATARGVHVAAERLRHQPDERRRRARYAEAAEPEDDELEPPRARRSTMPPGED